MKNRYKIFCKIAIIFMLILLIISNTKTSHADGFWTKVFTGADNFIEEGKNGNTTINTNKMETTFNIVYTILFNLGVVIAVVVGGIIGIKFMISSAEDKAKVKEALLPYVVGCIIVFGAFAIWKLVVSILSQI